MNNKKKYAAYTDTFAKIGLTEIDTIIYITLLEHGDLSPSDISKHTKLYRPSIYNSLEKLKKINLVHLSSKGKRVTYGAESPNKLESVFKKVEQDFFTEIEDLHHMYDTNKNKLYVTFGSGHEAIQDVYSDVVHRTEKNGVYYRYSSIDNKKITKRFVPSDYQRIRDSKNIDRYVITGERNVLRKRLGRTVKFVPEKDTLFEDSMNLVIYADKVSIIDYISESAITITHKKFAEMQKKIFTLLFDRL